MPSVNLKQETYDQLQELMAIELKERLKAGDKDKVMIEIIKNRYGVTFDTMINKLLYEYIKSHKKIR